MVRLDPVAANDADFAYMWIDPAPGVEPLIANADAFLTDFNLSDWDAFSFDARNPMKIDEIRVGATFDDVVVAVPEPASILMAITGLVGVYGIRRRRA